MIKNASGKQGWGPSAYLKEETTSLSSGTTTRPVPPAPPKSNGNGPIARTKPSPPAPPAKRPVSGRKPATTPTPRDSAVSINTNGSGSGRSTPTPSLAGGLAEALKARQAAMQRGRDDDDDW